MPSYASADTIFNAFVTDSALTADLESAEVLRDAHHLIRGSNQNPHWLLVFVLNQVIIQPLLHPKITLVLTSSSRPMKRIDFAFIDENATFMGSYDGPYTFRKFLGASLTMLQRTVWVGVFLFVIYFSYRYFGGTDYNTIAQALLQAVSVFMAVFTFLAFTGDSTKDFPMLMESEFDKVIRSDKYIAALGFAVLCFCVVVIGYVGSLRTLERLLHWKFEFKRLFAAGLFSPALVGTLYLFQLVLVYHFDRRNQYNCQIMTRSLLEAQQSDARRQLPPGNVQELIPDQNA